MKISQKGLSAVCKPMALAYGCHCLHWPHTVEPYGWSRSQWLLVRTDKSILPAAIVSVHTCSCHIPSMSSWNLWAVKVPVAFVHSPDGQLCAILCWFSWRHLLGHTALQLNLVERLALTYSLICSAFAGLDSTAFAHMQLKPSPRAVVWWIPHACRAIYCSSSIIGAVPYCWCWKSILVNLNQAIYHSRFLHRVNLGQQTFCQQDKLSGWHFVKMAWPPWTFCQDYADDLGRFVRTDSC